MTAHEKRRHRAKKVSAAGAGSLVAFVLLVKLINMLTSDHTVAHKVTDEILHAVCVVAEVGCEPILLDTYILH